MTKETKWTLGYTSQELPSLVISCGDERIEICLLKDNEFSGICLSTEKYGVLLGYQNLREIIKALKDANDDQNHSV